MSISGKFHYTVLGVVDWQGIMKELIVKETTSELVVLLLYHFDD